MKVLLFCILFLHCNASFFEEFDDAFASVEKNIENLVYDVKTTIECTIFAVGRVLSLGEETRSFDTSACSDDQKQVDYDVPDPPQRSVLIETPDKDFFSSHIDDSISNVNRTLFNLLQKHETAKNANGIKSELAFDTNRLSEISSILILELDKISKNIKRRFTDFSDNENEPSVDNIWTKVKILQEIQSVETNPTQTKEINEVFDKIIDILHVNSTNIDLTNGNKAETIFMGLESQTSSNISDIILDSKIQNKLNEDFTDSLQKVSQQTLVQSSKPSNDRQIRNDDDNFSKWKNEETVHNQEIQDQINEDLPNSLKEIRQNILKKSNYNELDNTNSGHNIKWSIKEKDDLEVQDKIIDKFPKNFKDVSLRIFNDVDNTRNDESDVKSSQDENKHISFQHYSVSEISDQTERTPSYFSSFSNLMPKDKESQANAVEQAQKIMQDNTYSEIIMSNIFDNPNVAAVNVFDNPGFFNFD